MPLTDTNIRNIKPTTSARKISDGGGLHIFITPTGSKLWRMAYRFDGRQKTLSFGAYPTVSLATARKRREEAKILLADGIDPSRQARVARQEKQLSARNTFAAIADEFLDKTEREGLADATLGKKRWLHVYTNPSGTLPTVSELISSGRFDSLSSQRVRQAIQLYTQSVEAADDIMAAATHDSLVMARKYPQLISVNVLKRGDFGLAGASSAAEYCDVGGMRANRGFLNDLSDNKDRFDIYFNISMETPQQKLIELHTILDEELGIVHDEATR